ncbi:hypothetical protein TPHA_0F00500 [Tetrapisispora phaffii CBS 4417]|uniref:Uncharacterized protein n=1 Tax=Tetrapisispora phaffii (strain ATCC 24235 / CBS 4417 / NBRC 1672 / NRRL Y-8282 / UCD 70-5) TaxID=1071381 RepID=G8BUV5_TETPH|nr:hypothetical protein TPHA_0F00500 [Tetrapisispora phaffii CBS 4417]CCE63537.1 hypothetical protein TPHA_0F00500 [Tetrapisispora phaffii CBS 4417]
MTINRQIFNVFLCVLLLHICLDFGEHFIFSLADIEQVNSASQSASAAETLEVNHLTSDTIYDEELYVKLPSTFRSKTVNMRDFKMENSTSIEDLRDQLAYEFPYNADISIPRSVWQTWKHSEHHELFPEYYKLLVEYWKNKTDHYSLITDQQLIPLLEDIYSNVPLVLEAIRAMPVTILKIDFFRYLILYAKGGIYSDLDTLPLKPLEHWVSVNQTKLNNLYQVSNRTNEPLTYQKLKNSNLPKMRKQGPGIVIGIEADPDRVDWQDWYARRVQFCQWTIQAKPGHPMLRELILNITATTLNSVYETNGKFSSFLVGPTIDYDIVGRSSHPILINDSISHLKTRSNVDGTDIMNWTGPGIFTDLVFEYFNNLLSKNDDVLLLNRNIEPSNTTQPNYKFYDHIYRNLNYRNIIPWEFFSLITKPVIIDDVMVLPITSFSPEVNQMGSKSREDPMAYVLHLFRGTWKQKADENKLNKTS